METRINDRGWVKNVAIVFLSVMLVLTFFSNTIMNRSLPEVATQMIGNNTITAQVRGTGRVSAAQNYEVKVDQTRMVKSVMVKVGQEVNAGDVLFILSDADSDELEAAQDNLRSLNTSYQKALINASQSDYARENRNIQRARENLEEAEQKRDEFRVSSRAMVAAENAVVLAKERVKAAQKKLDNAQRDLDDVGGRVETDSAEVQALLRAKNAAEKEYEAVLVIYKQKYDEIKNLTDEYIINHDDNYASATDKDAYLEQNRGYYMQEVVNHMQVNNGKLELPPDMLSLSESNNAEDSIPSEDDDEAEEGGGTKEPRTGAGDDDKNDPLLQEYKTAYEKVSAAEKKKDSATEAYNRANGVGNSSEYDSAARAVKRAQEALNAEQEKLTTAEERLTELKDMKGKYDAAAETVKTCQITLEDLMFDLQEQQKQDNKTAQLERLDLADLAAQVSRAQQHVNELRGDNGANEITAAVPGVIGSIDITAGNKTSPDMPLATIELPDMGYTMSFSVTNEQARLIHAGDSATVSNYYYGSQITATVSSVKTDPKNPQTSKLVTFDLSGDVNAGADLTVSVGQRSQEYDFVVPNSALRSDSNGDFILVITAKNSPLGNRYIATRVDVTKIASDDTSTAVTGALNRGDFVITTSTKPIENGQQVRMQDNL